MRLILSPKRFLCRRDNDRQAIEPEGAVCWTDYERPERAVIIEADRCGARLVVPWPVEKDEEIAVSFADALGHYRTEKARVAWTHELSGSGRTVIGLAYRSAA